jgi:hypothetical protein
MDTAFWESVAAEGRSVPADRPLPDLTIELTRMLGDRDPHVRADLAAGTLTDWIDRGVYDDLLTALGDGMTAGLTAGLGEDGTDSVFRRSYSALVLAHCIRRDNEQRLTPEGTIHRWGDALMSWLVREQDTRGFVPGGGWARAGHHGGLALKELAQSPSMQMLELTVLLDVVADRVTQPTPYRFLHGEDDALAAAAMSALHRDLVELTILEPWVARIAEAARLDDDGGDPFERSGNPRSFLRALYIALSADSPAPAVRGDLLLSLLPVVRVAVTKP